MKENLLAFLIIAGFIGTLKAGNISYSQTTNRQASEVTIVIFDPANYTGTLPEGMEIVVEEGDTMLKITTTGWDNYLTLDSTIDMGSKNHLTFKMRVDPGTCGESVSELIFFAGVYDHDSNQLFTIAHAAEPSLTELEEFERGSYLIYIKNGNFEQSRILVIE